METKTCTKCRETKPLGEFHRKAASKDGRQAHCRECDNATRRARRAKYAARADRPVPKSKRCPSCGEAKPGSAFSRNLAQKDGFRAQCRRCDNRLRSDHRRRKPEQQRALNQRRRAWKAGVPSEPVSYDDLRERDGDNCSLCGEPIDFTLQWPDPMSRSRDHILPLSLGGHDVASNLRLVHLRENIARGNRLSPEEAAELGLSDDANTESSG